MDILVAGLLLVVAVGFFVQKPIKVEVTHKHIVEAQPEERIIDPNKTDKLEKEVVNSMNAVISNMNAILNGGEIVED